MKLTYSCKTANFLVEEFMSENHTKINYEFLDSSKNFIYEARETGKTHSSYQ